MNGSYSRFRMFCDALLETGQDGVVDRYLLPTPDNCCVKESQCADLPPATPDDNRPLSRVSIMMLRDNWNKLLMEICCDEGLIAELKSRRVFNDMQLMVLKVRLPFCLQL